MPALICGSLAFDTITTFPGRFAEQILPEQVHILNVSFLVPTLRREFGGCAGNIAYNLKLIGGDPIPKATVGQDFAPYRAHFEKCGIRLDQVRVIDEMFTPQAFITTDLDNNQITAFHPGAMSRSHDNNVRDVEGVTFGIVAQRGHHQRRTPEQLEGVGDIAGAAAKFAPHRRHQERDIQDVHLVGHDLLRETAREVGDGVESKRAADQD